MRYVSLFALCALFLSAAAAFALDLDAARASGQVAEKRDGYVAQVSGGAEVKALVTDVNSRRREEYQRIAKEKGQTSDVVAKVAAEQIIQGLKPGSLFEAPGGGWKKR